MALGPYVTALVETITRGKPRAAAPAEVAAWCEGKTLAPDLRAVLDAWATHDVVIDLGDLTLDLALAARPVPGARADLLRLGTFEGGDLFTVTCAREDETDVLWIERENDWHAEDYGGLEAFLEYRAAEARTDHGRTDLDDALGWARVKASLGPNVASLIETFEDQPARPDARASLRDRIAGLALPPDLRGLLEAWIVRDGTVSVGDLTLYADCVDQAVSDADGDDRDDLLCLGEFACGDVLAVAWPPGARTEVFRVVHDAGWRLETVGGLETYLKRRVDRLRDKGEPTDLDAALAKRGK